MILADKIIALRKRAGWSQEEPALRRVTMEQASDYLALRRAAAPRVALATFLCILSPAVLLLLSGMSGDARFAVRGDTAAGIGLCVLLVLVAAAVALFITSGTKSKVYEFLEKEPFETEYGVAGMVKERKRAFAPAATRLNVIGTVLCILSVLPLSEKFSAAATFRLDFWGCIV